MVSENVYSELCYDPNMMSNLSGDGSLTPKITTEGYYIAPKGRESHTEYIAGKESVILVPSHTSDDKSDQLYHHHPQGGHMSSSSYHNDNVIERSADIDDPRTSDSQNNVTLQTGFRGNSECEVHSEVDEAGSKQDNNKPEPNINLQPGVTASKKFERQEDVVERNKITLGRNTFPGGSYMMAYAHKQGLAHNGKKVRRQILFLQAHGSVLLHNFSFHPGLRRTMIKKTNLRNPVCLAPWSQFNAEETVHTFHKDGKVQNEPVIGWFQRTELTTDWSARAARRDVSEVLELFNFSGINKRSTFWIFERIYPYSHIGKVRFAFYRFY